VDWKERYQGMTRVLTQRDKEVADAKSQLDTLSVTVKQLQDQLNGRSAELDVAKNGFQEQIKGKTTELEQAQKQLADLQAYKVKMDALKRFPDLLPVADTIPSLTSPDLMEQHLKTLQDGVDAIVARKAQQLSVGITPGPVSPVPVVPKDIGQLKKAMDAAVGTKDHAAASQAYLNALRAEWQKTPQ
jgi:DNA repair exonuclease SbcCD ATPase subunit